MKSVYKIRLQKGDKVVVRSGKYKGQVGKILEVRPRDNAVVVEGVNVFKKHLKKTQTNPQGGIKEITHPIAVSKVGLYEPTSKKPSRIKFSLKGDKKVRVYAKTGKEVA